MLLGVGFPRCLIQISEESSTLTNRTLHCDLVISKIYGKTNIDPQMLDRNLIMGTPEQVPPILGPPSFSFRHGLLHCTPEIGDLTPAPTRRTRGIKGFRVQDYRV